MSHFYYRYECLECGYIIDELSRGGSFFSDDNYIPLQCPACKIVESINVPHKKERTGDWSSRYFVGISESASPQGLSKIALCLLTAHRNCFLGLQILILHCVGLQIPRSVNLQSGATRAADF